MKTDLCIYSKIAQVSYGPESSKEYVNFGYGKASENALTHPEMYNAITLSIGKQKGGDAMKVSKVILEKN